ncbi:hypothetical protein K461DRAFT_226209, partial [Myriangium duriaei CBS 260.36]
PYHHFTFAQGFVYAPLPPVPFRPISPPHMAVFITNSSGAANVGLVRPGEIGDGPLLARQQAFWFNAYGVYIGCNNFEQPGCLYEISGYVYDATIRAEVLAYQRNIFVSGCPIYHGCPLTRVEFGHTLTGLTGFQIRAFHEGYQRIWYMDDLSLGWYDNSCAAGRLRAVSRR